MTLAEINRTIRAAIRAARKEGAAVVEVKIGDDAWMLLVTGIFLLWLLYAWRQAR